MPAFLCVAPFDCPHVVAPFADFDDVLTPQQVEAIRLCDITTLKTKGGYQLAAYVPEDVPTKSGGPGSAPPEGCV